MSISVRPGQHTIRYYSGERRVCIYNNSRRSAIVDGVLSLARGIHSLVQGDSTQEMPEYTRGMCHNAAKVLCFNAFSFFGLSFDKTKVIRGVNVPGSPGESKGLVPTGLHHLSLLQFENQFFAVDVTPAQIENEGFRNIEAIIGVTDPCETPLFEALPETSPLAKQLRSIYQGGDWRLITPDL